MTALSRGTQARALLLINMVAGSYWCPTLRAGGRRVDPWALGPGIAASMADAKQNNAGLPLFPGESPKAEEVKEWWKLVKPLITADQLALFNGTVPRALLDYTLATVPPTLTASTGGLSESAVESRNAMILTIQDANATKIKKRDTHERELRQGLMMALDVVVRPKAPLLMAKFERAHAFAPPYQESYDGAAALRDLVAMGEVSAMRPGEHVTHEGHMLALDLSTLPAGATADQFSLRVTTAMEKHIPFLKRKATPEWTAEWVSQQAPREHRIEVTGMYEALSAAEKADPHLVASKVVDIMSRAVDPAVALREALREAGASEFIGLATDGPGRRPGGLDQPKAKGKGAKGKPGNGKGKGAASATSSSSDTGAMRYTCCSVPPEQGGPLCKHAHPPPCWRDPRESPTLPKRLCNNEKLIADLTNVEGKISYEC